MEFQVYDVVVEDYLPKAIQGRRDDITSPEFDAETVDYHFITPPPKGCVAFVFGRAEDRRSVCVRVEGVHPKLFFEIGPDDTIDGMRKELRQEVWSTGASVELRRASFCHMGSYEPDPDAPSGRRVHEYAEASYSSLKGWYAACRLRRDADVRRVGRKLARGEERLRAAKERCAEASTAARRREVGGVGAAEQARADVATAEQHVELLRTRHRSLASDEQIEQIANDPPDAGERAETVRDAQERLVDPVTRFFHETGICPAKWVRVPTAEIVEHRVTTCDVELEAAHDAFEPLPERVMDAPYTVLYYDIETLGLDPSKDAAIQVALVFVRGSTVDEHLVAIGAVGAIEGVTVHSCFDETELLRQTRALIVRMDPDFVVAYNGINFDNRFLAVRAAKGCISADGVPEFFYLSRFALRPCRLKSQRLASQGQDNHLHFFDMPGRCNLDWFLKFKRDLTSEPSYKLNHFAKRFCGDEKEDMHYKEIPILQAGSSADRARLGSYCVHDARLLYRLDLARTMTVEILQFSAVFGVKPEWIYFRGQQVRYVSQLLSTARTVEKVPLILNRPENGFSGEDSVGFQGATVNEPMRGFFKDPVAVLDWKSLYPSVMIAHNLCPSTWVEERVGECAGGYRDHAIDENFVARFATVERHKGILPRILEGLLEERSRAKKSVKAHQATAKDEALTDAERQRSAALAKVFDGRQLALKVACNSVYGACGAIETGKYPCLAVSATTTFEGREAMVVKRKILPERFPGIKIVYGDTDSVMVQFAGVAGVDACAVLAEEAALFVTDHFRETLRLWTMELEFEKLYCPYLLQKKKRYLGLKYEPEGPDGTMVCKGVDAKGVETERKDTLPFLKDIMCGVRDALLYDIDPGKAVACFRRHMDLLVADRVPMDKLVLRKNLSSKVEGKSDTIVQARVNALRRQREPGSEAATNEQVEYVILNGHRKSKTTDLAEDPAYAREHGLKLNRLWYFEHCIEDAMAKMFEDFEGVDYKGMRDHYRAALDSERLGVGDSLRVLLEQSKRKDGGDARGQTGAPTPSSSSSSSLARVPLPPAKKKKKGPGKM